MKSKKILFIISKILFVGIFFSAGLNKIFNFSGTAGYMESVGMPFTSFFLIGAILLLTVGSLSILFDYKPKLGSILLIIFLVPATLIFHNNIADQIQMIMFMKNVSILGGLIIYFLFCDEIIKSVKK